MTRVRLRYAGVTATVRELCGEDEERVAGADTATAVALLDRLLQPGPPPTVAPGDAVTLCAADRDRLLAVVYLSAYGDRVVSTLSCTTCAARFDLDFSLRALLESLTPGPAGERGDDGRWRLADGRQVRLPTAADELAAAELPPDEARSFLAARVGLDADQAAAALALVAPLCDTEVDATCPECGQDQEVHFDLQGYLLHRLVGERRQRIAEVHQLAAAYGWHRHDILALPRSVRHAHVDLIGRDRGARWRTT